MIFSTDPIVRSYIESKRKLPTIFCGKYDDDHLNEGMSYDEAKETNAKFYSDKFAGTDAEAHDSYLTELSKTVKHPTMDHYNRMATIINTAPDEYKNRLRDKHLHPVVMALRKEPTEYHGDLMMPSRENIRAARNAGLTMYIGRFAKDIHGTHFQIHPDNSMHMVEAGSKKQSTPYQLDHDTVAELDDLHADHMDKHKHFAKIQQYTNDSMEVNKTLAAHYTGATVDDSRWQRTYDENLEHSDKISDVVSSAPGINRPFKVFTGLSKSSNVWGITKGGTQMATFHAPTFVSSSFHYGTAAGFAKQKNEPDETEYMHDILHISVPKEFHHGLFVEPRSENKGEIEYLIDKGHNFTIHPNPKYTTENGRIMRIWNADIHPKKEIPLE